MKYIFIFIIFLSCTDVPNTIQQVSAERQDTVKLAPARNVIFPALFETAFISGTTHQQNKTTLWLYGINIGNLKTPGGHIIACDPLHIDEYGIPYTQLFPTGEFPVQLAIAKLNEEETIAFARIYFSAEPVASWSIALLKEQQPVPLNSIDAPGYGVDAGIGIFIDEIASRSLNKDSLLKTYSAIQAEMSKHFHINWRYAIHNFGAHNLAAFTTGLGDGRYSTYIGYDAGGKPCRLLTDFGFLDWQSK